MHLGCHYNPDGVAAGRPDPLASTPPEPRIVATLFAPKGSNAGWGKLPKKGARLHACDADRPAASSVAAMRVSTLGRARRSSLSASALKRVTNTPFLIGIEMFILATFPGDIVGSPMRSMMGFASSPSSKLLRPAGFPANAQNSSARVSSSWAMAVSEVRRGGAGLAMRTF